MLSKRAVFRNSFQVIVLPGNPHALFLKLVEQKDHRALEGTKVWSSRWEPDAPLALHSPRELHEKAPRCTLKRAADDRETAREGRPALNSRGARTKSTVSARNPEIVGSWPHQPQAPLLALPWGPGRSGEVWRPGAGRARSRFPSPWCFSCRFQILRNERYSFTITEKRSTIQFFHL